MWKKTENRAEFERIMRDMLEDPAVQHLKNLEQHSKNASRYDHCIFVAYMSFLACRSMGLDHVAAARAGMLHDFHYGGVEQGVKRLWRHPHDALEMAQRHYQLSEVEEDIIVKHMWPLTRPLPRHKETVVVSFADKLCCLAEVMRLDRLFKVKKNLVTTLAALAGSASAEAA